MGMVGYYRIFVEGFSKIANLVTSFLSKGAGFKWTNECDQDFSKLEQCLTSTPILKVADMDRLFIICTDASKQGLGVVLSQDGRVISYASHKLRSREQIYASHDLELTTVVHAFLSLASLSGEYEI